MTTTDGKTAPAMGAWTGGLTLFAVGGLLLVQQLGVEVSGAMWGGLLIIPGVGTAVAAYRRYLATGATSAVGSEAILAVFFLALAGAVISGVGLHLLWPILLMGLAFALIARSLLRRT